MAPVERHSIHGGDFTDAVDEVMRFRVAVVKQAWD